MTDAEKLCMLMEPKPSGTTWHGNVSSGGFWWGGLDGEWHPRIVDHNAMAEVRTELKRRGLYFAFNAKVANSVGLVNLLDAPLDIQIRAAVKVLEVANAYGPGEASEGTGAGSAPVSCAS